jgi:hypothetical protein
MKFIKNINKYCIKKVNLIDNIKIFIKFNNGINCYTTKHWYKNGLIHRENDKPAIEWSNGRKEWWINGKLHRENDKPAIELFSSGLMENL